MANLSVYELMGSIYGCEAELLSFALNHPGDDEKQFSIEQSYEAKSIIRGMAVSDPSAFARLVGRYISMCVCSGRLDADVLQREQAWHSELIGVIKEAVSGVKKDEQS